MGINMQAYWNIIAGLFMGCLTLREVSSDPLSPCNQDPDCMQFVEYCNSLPLVEPPPLVSANSPPNRIEVWRFIGLLAFGPTSHQTMIIEYVLGLQQTAS